MEAAASNSSRRDERRAILGKRMPTATRGIGRSHQTRDGEKLPTNLGLRSPASAYEPAPLAPLALLTADATPRRPWLPFAGPSGGWPLAMQQPLGRCGWLPSLLRIVSRGCGRIESDPHTECTGYKVQSTWSQPRPRAGGDAASCLLNGRFH